MKRTISLIICFIIAFGSIAIGINSLTAGAYSSWQEAYAAKLRQEIKENKNKNYVDATPCFSLIYVDNNDTPELVISAKNAIHAGSASLYTFNNGKTVDLGNYGSYCEFSYLEKEGYIYEYFSGGGGIVDVRIYKMNNSTVSEVIRFSDNEAMGGDIDFTHYINDELVTEEEYYKQLNEWENKNWKSSGFDYELTEANINKVFKTSESTTSTTIISDLTATQQKELEKFLIGFYPPYFPTECFQYDYSTVSKPTIMSHLLSYGLFENFYPGNSEYRNYNNIDEAVGPDPKGIFKFYGENSYDKSNASQVDWVLKNIFNCSDANIKTMIEYGSKAADNYKYPSSNLSNFAFYKYGNYYYSEWSGGIGGNLNAYAKINSVTKKRLNYLVYYSIIVYEYDDPLKTPFNTYNAYAQLQYKKIDGKYYWSLYKNSKNKFSFIDIKETNTKKEKSDKVFTLGRDNWKFRNIDTNFTSSNWNKLYEFTSNIWYDRYYLHDDDLTKFKFALSDSDLAAVENELYNKWEGSCSGMSITSLLAFEDFSVTDKIRGSANVLHDIQKNGDDDIVESFINYYHVQWVTSNVSTNVYKGLENLINEIDLETDDLLNDQKSLNKYHSYVLKKMFDYGETNNPYYIRISGNDFTHAITGIGSEHGSYEVNGTTYDSRIIVYDSSYGDKSEKSNIYFNYGDGSFYIENYRDDDLNFLYPVFNVDDLYTVDYSGNRSKTFIPATPTFIYSGKSDELAYSAGDNKHLINESLIDTKNKLYSISIPGNTKENVSSFLFFTPTANGSQVFDLNKNTDCSLSYHSGKSFLSLETEKAKAVEFNSENEIKASGLSGKYILSSTFDSVYTCLPWPSVYINGEKADQISMKNDNKQGIIIESDGLGNAIIILRNKDTSSSYKLKDTVNKVLISTSNEDTTKPVFLADIDNDGTFETVINVEEVKQDSNAIQSNTKDKKTDNSKRSNIRLIIIISAIVFALLIAAIIFIILKNKKKQAQINEEDVMKVSSEPEATQATAPPPISEEAAPPTPKIEYSCKEMGFGGRCGLCKNEIETLYLVTAKKEGKEQKATVCRTCAQRIITKFKKSNTPQS